MTFEEIKAVVRINVIDMFRFNLTCAYLRKKGIFAIAFSLVCFVMCIVSFSINDTISALLFLGGALIYTGFVPVDLYYKAVLHVRKYKVNDRDLFYTFNGQGLSITSDDNNVSIAWESIARIVETNSQLVVFINKIHGYIVPKKYFETSIEPLQELIASKLSETKYKKYLISKKGIVIPKIINKGKATQTKSISQIFKDKVKAFQKSINTEYDKDDTKINDINENEINSSEINSSEINSSEINSSETNSIETNSIEINSIEINASEVNSKKSKSSVKYSNIINTKNAKKTNNKNKK